MDRYPTVYATHALPPGTDAQELAQVAFGRRTRLDWPGSEHPPPGAEEWARRGALVLPGFGMSGHT